MTSIQKVIKYIAIAFAVSLIVGIFYGIYAGLSIIGGISKSDNPTYELSDFNSSSKILYVNIDSSKLSIVNGDTFKVVSNNKYIDVKQDLNKIIVKENSHKKFKNPDDYIITVYVPNNFTLDDVNIATKAGTINIDYLKAKTLDISLNAGEINIKNIDVIDVAKISNNAGEIDIDKSSFNNLDLNLNVGEVNINTILTGNSKLSVNVGELNVNLLDNISNYNIYSKKGLGNIKIQNENITSNTTIGNGINKIDLNCSLGSIIVNYK